LPPPAAARLDAGAPLIAIATASSGCGIAPELVGCSSPSQCQRDVVALYLFVGLFPVVSLLGLLQKSGAIAMGRATCEIVDRAALERRACECYGIISAGYRHLNERGCHEHVPDDGPWARRDPVVSPMSRRPIGIAQTS